MNKSSGFTLVELMVVVAVLSIIAALSLPSLVSARKAGNEAATISSLRTLSTVNIAYRMRYQSYASSLAALTTVGYVDSVLGSGTKSGYTFAYSAATDSWSVTASPILPGTTGDRGFFVDDSGVIRFSGSGAATSASPAID